MNEDDDPNPVYQRARQSLVFWRNGVRFWERHRRDSFAVAILDLTLGAIAAAFGQLVLMAACALTTLVVLWFVVASHRRLMRAVDRYTECHDDIASYRATRDRFHASTERNARLKLQLNLFERN